MSMRLVQRQRIVQDEDSATRELFQKTGELLDEADFQRALEFVSARKNMDRYNSMMDFLFCELVLGYRGKCFRFYDGKSPPLRDEPESTPEQIEKWDRFLVTALHVAKERLGAKRSASWKIFREEVLIKSAA